MESKKQNQRKKRTTGTTHEVTTLDNSISPRRFGDRTVIRFPGIGFPDELKCTLCYVENNIQFVTVPSPAAQVFRINSLFDPNLTGTGHQPKFFDQITPSIYSLYCVTACRVEAYAIQQASATMQRLSYGYSDSNISTDTQESLAEDRWFKNADISGSNGNGLRKCILPSISIAKLLGQPSLETDSNSYCAYNANPVDVAFYIFKTTTMDGATASDLSVTFKIFFNCIFKELTQPTES